jgi:hypothetical protein
LLLQHSSVLDSTLPFFSLPQEPALGTEEGMQRYLTFVVPASASPSVPKRGIL